MPDDADLLRRLLDGDNRATAECCERYLPLLLANLGWVAVRPPDEHLIEDAVHRALVEFVTRPQGYDPARSPLLVFLRMIARRRLINLMQRERPHREHRASLELVDLSRHQWNDRQDAPDLPLADEDTDVEAAVDAQLDDPRDREAFRMIVDRVRKTREYAVVYGLTGLPVAEQQAMVKKHKDRLKQVMRRMGMKLRGDG